MSNEQKNKLKEEIIFDCKDGVGLQKLVFSDKKINVILRNQEKHNKKYKITIEEVENE